MLAGSIITIASADIKIAIKILDCLVLPALTDVTSL